MKPSAVAFIAASLAAEDLGRGLIARLGDRAPTLCARLRETNRLSEQCRALIEVVERLEDEHAPHVEIHRAMTELNETFARHMAIVALIDADPAAVRLLTGEPPS